MQIGRKRAKPDGCCCSPDQKIVAIKVLAIVTFLLVPLDILINVFLSYRLDPAGFFKNHTGYQYSRNLTGTYESVFWTHKLTTIIWACSIVVHICVITVWGKVGCGFHELLGGSIVLSVNIAATSGLNMLVEGAIRYDTFTAAFVLIAAVFNYLLSMLFFVTHILTPIVRIRNYRVVLHHSKIGFMFLISPLGMLMQFIIYSILVAIVNDSSHDYLVWQISLWVCQVAAIVMTFFFHHSYFKVTRHSFFPNRQTDPDNPDVHEKHSRKICECCWFGLWLCLPEVHAQKQD